MSYVRTEYHRQLMKKVGLSNKGSVRPLPLETRRKISIALTGKKVSEATKERIRIARKRQVGDKVGVWKGDEVSYSGLHSYVRKYLGTPSNCENCGNDQLPRRQYQWANISGEYRRSLDDWVRLCARCHHWIDNLSSKLVRDNKTGRYQRG